MDPCKEILEKHPELEKGGYKRLVESLCEEGLNPNLLHEYKGLSGAFVYRALLDAWGGKGKGVYVIKFDKAYRWAGEQKVRRILEAAARTDGQKRFISNHIPDATSFPKEGDAEGKVAIVYDLAGQSGENRALSEYSKLPRELELAGKETAELLLDLTARLEGELPVIVNQSCHDLLGAWAKGEVDELEIEMFLEFHCAARFADGAWADASRIARFEVNELKGGPFLNPLVYLRDKSWSSEIEEAIVTGYVHGDLNTNNVSVRFSEGQIENLSLIDISSMKQGQPLMLDHAFLELWYLLHDIPPGLLTEERLLAICDALNGKMNPDALDPAVSGYYQILHSRRLAVKDWAEKKKITSYFSLLKLWTLASVAAGLRYATHGAAYPKSRFFAFLWSSRSLQIHLQDHPDDGTINAPSEVMILDSPNTLALDLDQLMRQDYLMTQDPLVSESMVYNQKKYKSNLPLVVWRNDLDGNLWPGKNFVEYLLFDFAGTSVEKLNFANKQKRPVIRLNVDISKAKYGIYNNRGKSFLEDPNDGYYRSNQDLAERKDADDKIHAFLKEETDGVLQLDSIYPKGFPLRWASAGYLPIVRYENDWWLMLFFRDRLPIGWNVANGGSESEEECRDANRIIGREFAEESGVLEAPPDLPGKTEVGRYTFVERKGPNDVNIDPASRWAHAHILLRKKDDDITLVASQKLTKDVRSAQPDNSPKPMFEVRVSNGNIPLSTSHNTIFSINVHEFGVEAMYPCVFELVNEVEKSGSKKEDHIVDGEVIFGPDGIQLVRRPVGLFRTSFLADAIRRENGFSLENPNQSDAVERQRSFEGCRFIAPEIPEAHCRVFKWDIGRRLKLNKLGDTQEVQSWLRQLQSGGTFSRSPLTSLCPVTWKTLDIAFKHELIPIEKHPS